MINLRRQRSYGNYVRAVAGMNISLKRSELGLSRRQLNDQLAATIGKVTRPGRRGTNESYLRSIENGAKEVSLSRLLLIADLVGLRPSELFAGALTSSEVADQYAKENDGLSTDAGV